MKRPCKSIGRGQFSRIDRLLHDGRVWSPREIGADAMREVPNFSLRPISKGAESFLWELHVVTMREYVEPLFGCIVVYHGHLMGVFRKL